MGSVQQDDKLGRSSNHGRCVDILAPGVQIESTGHESSRQERVLTGTSMATPHVAGLIAHFLSAYPSRYFNPYASSEYDYFHTDSMDRIVTPLAMKRALKEMSWRGLIAPLPQDTPNLLVFNNFTANQRFDFWDEEEEMFFFDY